MTPRLLTLITLFWLACSVQASSRTVPNMYAFEQPVTDAGAPARKVAVREAMAAVLVRLTGDRKVAERPQAQGLLENSSGYVQRYDYAQRPVVPVDSEDADSTSEQSGLPAPEPATQLLLRGQFAARALDAAVRSAGLPLWSAQRPQIFTAITTASEAGSLVLDVEIAAAYPELMATAAQRGLPLHLPAQNTLSAIDATEPDSPILAALVEQQEADYLLVGHLSEQAGKWVIQAELHEAGMPLQSWRLRSREPGPLLRAVVNRSGDLLAQRHALAAYTPGGESIVGLWVHGVGSGADYMRVQQHLQKLPAVDQLSLVAVVGGALVYRAGTESAAEQLDRSIRQAGRLRSETLPPGAAQSPVWTGEFEYHYRLN